jgi:hypothetical protein
MKAQFKVNPNLVIEMECKDHKDLFEGLSSIQEVFKHRKCGCCNSEDVSLMVRNVEKDKKSYTYYELLCQKCRARFHFGIKNDDTGRLFPKTTEDGKVLPNGGWSKYAPKEE